MARGSALAAYNARYGTAAARAVSKSPWVHTRTQQSPFLDDRRIPDRRRCTELHVEKHDYLEAVLNNRDRSALFDAAVTFYHAGVPIGLAHTYLDTLSTKVRRVA